MADSRQRSWGMEPAARSAEPSSPPPPVGVVLAAGRSERLAKVTGGTSKALLRVGGTTLVERAVRSLRDGGVTVVVVVVGHDADAVSGPRVRRGLAPRAPGGGRAGRAGGPRPRLHGVGRGHPGPGGGWPGVRLRQAARGAGHRLRGVRPGSNGVRRISNGRRRGRPLAGRGDLPGGHGAPRAGRDARGAAVVAGRRHPAGPGGGEEPGPAIAGEGHRRAGVPPPQPAHLHPPDHGPGPGEGPAGDAVGAGVADRAVGRVVALGEPRRGGRASRPGDFRAGRHGRGDGPAPSARLDPGSVARHRLRPHGRCGHRGRPLLVAVEQPLEGVPRAHHRDVHGRMGADRAHGQEDLAGHPGAGTARSGRASAGATAGRPGRPPPPDRRVRPGGPARAGPCHGRPRLGLHGADPVRPAAGAPGVATRARGATPGR